MTTTAAAAAAASTMTKRIRDDLRENFPEIDALCTDAYLESMVVAATTTPASVPEDQRDEEEKEDAATLTAVVTNLLEGSLEWRRSYGVDALRDAFEANDGVFVPVQRDSYRRSGFVPSRALIEVAAGGAVVLLDDDRDHDDDELLVATENESETYGPSERSSARRRLAVCADTSKMDWWKTGVTDGLRYHVLVLEEALDRIRTVNNNKIDDDDDDDDRDKLDESLILCVDTTSTSSSWLPRPPPPPGALFGMVHLLQKAYPERIGRVLVGPVSPWLRTLIETIRPLLRPRSRSKIVLLEEPPSEHLKRRRRRKQQQQPLEEPRPRHPSDRVATEPKHQPISLAVTN